MGILEFIQEISVQTAVYWGTYTVDVYSKKVWPAPVEIKVRWDGKTQKVKNPYGEDFVSMAEVLVNQEVVLGGYLYLGSLEDLTPAQKADPVIVNGAYPIKIYERVPLFKSTTEFVKTAYL